MRVNNIKIASIHFESSITAGGVFLVFLKSMLILILSFGMAAPWVYSINLKYYLENLKMNGELNMNEMEQAPKVSEGAFMDQLADFFDADVV